MKLTQIIHSFINPRRLSENADFLQNKAKFGEKAQFTGVNEHFELNFNAVLEERCVFGQPPSMIELSIVMLFFINGLGMIQH